MTDLPKISGESVSEATGWSWEEWFKLLDEEGGTDMEYKELVKILREKGDLKDAWWCQAITTEYERARGLRTGEEKAEATFDVDVKRTFDTTPRRAWDTVTRGEGLRAWLGEFDGSFSWEKGQTYQTKDGSTGQVLIVRPGSHVRLTWRPIGWERDSIIQVSILPVSRTATIAFHQENIPTFKERERMRRHWNKMLDALVDLL